MCKDNANERRISSLLEYFAKCSLSSAKIIHGCGAEKRKEAERAALFWAALSVCPVKAFTGPVWLSAAA